MSEHNDHNDHMNTNTKFSSADDIIAYIKGGRGCLTIKSLKTGEHFTYIFQRLKKNRTRKFIDLPLWVHSTISDVKKNEADGSEYEHSRTTFIGTCWFNRRQPMQFNLSSHGPDKMFPALIAFDWLVQKLQQKHLPESVEVWHEGICCMCGKTLTHPDSIATGIGPVCKAKQDEIFQEQDFSGPHADGTPF